MIFIIILSVIALIALAWVLRGTRWRWIPLAIVMLVFVACIGVFFVAVIGVIPLETAVSWALGPLLGAVVALVALLAEQM